MLRTGEQFAENLLFALDQRNLVLRSFIRLVMQVSAVLEKDIHAVSSNAQNVPGILIYVSRKDLHSWTFWQIAWPGSPYPFGRLLC